MGTRRKGLPRWAELGRRAWTHTGGHRPPFAEQPGPGQESVWDYPRPPALVADDRRVRVELAGVVVADTTGAVRVLETSHPPTFYLPPGDVDRALLVRAPGASRCEWKGEATYWDVVVEGARADAAAWSYEAPFDDFAPLKGYLGFYPSRLDCFVDGAPVAAQPGGFYAGWITGELVGPFKGAPGTQGW